MVAIQLRRQNSEVAQDIQATSALFTGDTGELATNRIGLVTLLCFSVTWFSSGTGFCRTLTCLVKLRQKRTQECMNLVFLFCDEFCLDAGR